MSERLKRIIELIRNIKDVKIVNDFELDGSVIKGMVSVSVDAVSLCFNLHISQHYPFQFHDTECIRFQNNELLEYNHVNDDGSICIHTHQCADLKTKINLDFDSLKHWIIKYYINREQDNHYEHIIVPYDLFENCYDYFLFTDVDYQFTQGQFGFFNYSFQSNGIIKENNSRVYLVQSFEVEKKLYPCKWSKFYQSVKMLRGIFLFTKVPPIINERFAVQNWIQLEPFVNQSFLDFLYSIDKGTPKNKRPIVLPLLIGYEIASGEIHWQCALIKHDEFPNYGVKSANTSRSFIGKFKDQKIIWAQTKNISYKYYFGRGTLNNKLSESKILIIGIGAIGSILATTLVRGGCTSLSICDHDIKEPENVCRSEYLFLTGITNKVNDLAQLLSGISPFAEIELSEQLTDFTKFIFNDPNSFKVLEVVFNKYDLIFDCTTDNDLAYIFDQLDLNAEVFNLSITNQAKSLLCVRKPNIYKWICDVFPMIDSEKTILYNPTGCWNPTFSASYNDIESLVQYAIRHINLSYENQKPISNFYLTSSFEDSLIIKLHQF